MPVEEVYVNSFDVSEVAWSEVGASPYLQDSNVDYIGTDAGTQYESKFGFPASAGSGVINSVKIRVEAYNVPADIGRTANVYVWDGAAWQLLGTVGEAFAYTWYELNASAILTTWAKINGAKLRIRSNIGDGTVYVRRATRKVDYTPVAGAQLRRLLVGVGL